MARGEYEGYAAREEDQARSDVRIFIYNFVFDPAGTYMHTCRPVKFPIVDPRTSAVCLITKDPQREYKDLIASQGIKFISRVVDVRHLKGKWKPFEARRMLLRENGLFLADERVVPLLPNLLGKIFFNAKKYAISHSVHFLA